MFGSWRKFGFGLKGQICVVLLVALIGVGVESFPDGAPGEACVRHKPNHGGKAQPVSKLPFQVTASSATFQPGEAVAGEEGIAIWLD